MDNKTKAEQMREIARKREELAESLEAHGGFKSAAREHREQAARDRQYADQLAAAPPTDDEWVEVDEGTVGGLPNGTRIRQEWVRGLVDAHRVFVHRDDLPDPDKEMIERMAKAIWNAGESPVEWESQSEVFREDYRAQARAALAEVEGTIKAQALREYANAHRHPWTVCLRADGSPVTVNDLMRETATQLEAGEQ